MARNRTVLYQRLCSLTSTSDCFYWYTKKPSPLCLYETLLPQRAASLFVSTILTATTRVCRVRFGWISWEKSARSLWMDMSFCLSTTIGSNRKILIRPTKVSVSRKMPLTDFWPTTIGGCSKHFSICIELQVRSPVRVITGEDAPDTPFLLRAWRKSDCLAWVRECTVPRKVILIGCQRFSQIVYTAILFKSMESFGFLV